MNVEYLLLIYLFYMSWLLRTKTSNMKVIFVLGFVGFYYWDRGFGIVFALLQVFILFWGSMLISTITEKLIYSFNLKINKNDVVKDTSENDSTLKVSTFFTSLKEKFNERKLQEKEEIIPKKTLYKEEMAFYKHYERMNLLIEHDPTSVVGVARNFMESIVNDILEFNNIDMNAYFPENESNKLINKSKIIKDKGLMPVYIFYDIETIRKYGNQASHAKILSKTEASKVVQLSQKLYGWYVKEYNIV
jgi:hypothetical protein